MCSDEELMVAYVEKGDDEAFRELFDRYANRLQRLMERGGVPSDVAPDLVQQSFLNLHEARHDFDPDKSLRPWLYTIALNLRREYFRRKGRRNETTVEEMPSQSAGPERIRRLEDAQLVERAMESLTDALRTVIELHWFEELTFREIADTLDITRSAAKVRAHRAYKKMRAAIDSPDDLPN
jgi:RNA polymerase sigma-70 factor (ECF subfamily)